MLRDSHRNIRMVSHSSEAEERDTKGNNDGTAQPMDQRDTTSGSKEKQDESTERDSEYVRIMKKKRWSELKEGCGVDKEAQNNSTTYNIKNDGKKENQ